LNTRAKRLAIPLGGAVAASALLGASLSTTAEAAPDRKTRVLAASQSKAKAVAGRWTSARLKSATRYTSGAAASGKFKVSKKASADGGAGRIGPTSQSAPSGGRSKNVNLPRTIGRVFFEVGGKAYYCSATSVHGQFRNLVATAGHCVYNTEANRPVDNFVFIPGYYQGKAPWGIYVGAQYHTHYDFDVYEDYDRDYAFVNVYNGVKREGNKWVDIGRLGDNVGGQGFAWNQPIGKKSFVFGYPTGSHPDGDRPYTGETPKFCYGQTYAGPAVPEFKVEEHVAIKCAFTPGSSGGPFLLQYSSAKRTGYLNGVVSLVIDSDGNQRFDRTTTPYFDGETASIYKYASNRWTGSLLRR